MVTVSILIATLVLLAMGSELAENWRDQWVPQYRRRLFGQTSPLGVIFVGVGMGAVGGIAGGVAFGVGFIVNDISWAWAWATLVVIFLCLYELRRMFKAVRAARQYIHPKNPKSKFWP